MSRAATHVPFFHAPNPAHEAEPMSDHKTPFSQQIAFFSRGQFDDEVTDELADLIKAVRTTGKSGELTIKIKVSLLNARDENALKLAPKVSCKKPQPAPYETIMFSTADGDLLRDDPQQRSLNLKEVPSTPKAAAVSLA